MHNGDAMEFRVRLLLLIKYSFHDFSERNLHASLIMRSLIMSVGNQCKFSIVRTNIGRMVTMFDLQVLDDAFMLELNVVTIMAHIYHV